MRRSSSTARRPLARRRWAIVAELRCQRRPNPRPASLRCGLKKPCSAVDKNRAPKEMLMASISDSDLLCFRRSDACANIARFGGPRHRR
jgi:hypothetical protein